jgi:hypothetical protein
LENNGKWKTMENGNGDGSLPRAYLVSLSSGCAFRYSTMRSQSLSVAKTLGVLSFTPLTMLQACAQAVDFKVGHHFGEGQPEITALQRCRMAGL